MLGRIGVVIAMATLGQMIYHLRKERGWTQAELGARSGMHQASVAKLEKGVVSNPTRETLESLALAFGVTVDSLLHGGTLAVMDLTHPPLDLLRAAGLGRLATPIEQELLRLWPRMAEPSRRHMWDLMRALQEQGDTLAALHRLSDSLRDLELALNQDQPKKTPHHPQTNGIADGTS